MDWAAVWMDIFGGLLIAGALAAWVSNSFWQGLFLQGHGALATVWGPLIGPLVAMLSFVCSIGNVPLASHMADSYLRIAAFLQATDEMSPARTGRHRVLQTKELT